MPQRRFHWQPLKGMRDWLNAVEVDTPLDREGKPIGRKRRSIVEWFAGWYDNDPRRIDPTAIQQELDRKKKE